VVGIVGKAGAGKSTLAHELDRLISDGYLGAKPKRRTCEVFSLAGPVKDIALTVLSGQADGKIDKEKLYRVGSRELTGRKLLQIVGTEFGRYLDQDIWVSILFEDIGACNIDVAIVDDVRFLNEFEAMDVRIGIIDANAKPNDFGNHASESEMDGLLMPEKLDLLLVRKGDTYSPVVAGKPKGKITAADIAAMIAEVKK